MGPHFRASGNHLDSGPPRSRRKLVSQHKQPLDGALLLKMRGHVSAVVDGVIHDTFDSRKMVVRGAFMLAPNLTDSDTA